MRDKISTKVRLRGGFSDRNGIKNENTQIQFKDFDDTGTRYRHHSFYC